MPTPPPSAADADADPEAAPAPAPRLVTAAILWRGGRVLAAQRGGPGDRHAGGWEFPGGKLEPGETPEACLARELHEELGIRASIGPRFGVSDHHYPGGAIRLLAYHVHSFSGEPQATVHTELRWVDAAGLAGLPFLPADIPLVDQLRRDWSTHVVVGTGDPPPAPRSKAE